MIGSCHHILPDWVTKDESSSSKGRAAGALPLPLPGVMTLLPKRSTASWFRENSKLVCWLFVVVVDVICGSCGVVFQEGLGSGWVFGYGGKMRRWCGVKGMAILKGEGVDIDNAAGASEAHVLSTPVPDHLTCPKHGNVTGQISIPGSDEGSYCTLITLDSCA